MSTGHEWTVYLLVETYEISGSVAKYRPACSCGWHGPMTSLENRAAERAFKHATGKDAPAHVAKSRTPVPKDPLIEPGIFEGSDYEQKTGLGQ